MSDERSVEQEVIELEACLHPNHRHFDTTALLTRLVTARREAEAKLANAEQEIRDHAEWAREYGKTPDGQAHLAWAKKLAEAERQRDEARKLAAEWRAVACPGIGDGTSTVPHPWWQPFPWEDA